MTSQQGKNQVLASVTIFLIIASIVLAFPLDQLWVGIGLFIVAIIIILLKVTWSIAVWGDDTLRRWTDKNLAPKDGIEFTFRLEEDEKDEEK